MIISNKPITIGRSGYSGIGNSGYSGFSGELFFADKGGIAFTTVTSGTIVDAFAELANALMTSKIMKPLVVPPGGGGIPFP